MDKELFLKLKYRQENFLKDAKILEDNVSSLDSLEFCRLTGQEIFSGNLSNPDLIIPPSRWGSSSQLNYDGEENNLYRD